MASFCQDEDTICLDDSDDEDVSTKKMPFVPVVTASKGKHEVIELHDSFDDDDGAAADSSGKMSQKHADMEVIEIKDSIDDDDDSMASIPQKGAFALRQCHCCANIISFAFLSSDSRGSCGHKA